MRTRCRYLTPTLLRGRYPRKCGLFALAWLIWLATPGVQAATLSWTDTHTSGDFFTASNWTDVDTGLPAVTAPTGNDSILMEAGNYTVTKAGSFDTINGMVIGTGVLLKNQNGLLGWNEEVANFTNAGTIHFVGSDAIWKIYSAGKISYTVYNPGLVSVDGVTVSILTRDRTINNTGGSFEVINGGNFSWYNSFNMIGGTVCIDATSSIKNNGVNQYQQLNGVAVTNAGTLFFSQTETATGDGNVQVTGFIFMNKGSLDNSGTVTLVNSSTGVRKADTKITFDATSRFENSGTLSITNIGTSSLHKTYLSSVNSVTNAGTINLYKTPTAGSTYFGVTGAGKTFVQTHGSVTLAGGAALILPSGSEALIQGGTIGGNGAITGALRVHAEAALTSELRDAVGDHDMLTVSGTVQLDAGCEVHVTVAEGFDPGDTDTFDILTATGGFTSTDAATLVPVDAGTRLWVLEIIGVDAPQTLRLVFIPPPKGTVISVQ